MVVETSSSVSIASIDVDVAATGLATSLETALPFFAARMSVIVNILYPLPSGKLLGQLWEWWSV
jgi:hypothetical protein